MKDGDIEIFKLHSEFCQALANEKRLRILWLIAEQEYSVGELSKELNIPITNISQHLRILKDKGAVVERKAGQQVFYTVSNPKFIKGCKLIRESIIETHIEKSKLFSA